MAYTITRYHDISAGHRVAGHETKCRHLHGHNYRVHFTCQVKQLDDLGRVVDFSVVKQKLCQWLENNWDHKMILWVDDPWTFSIQDHPDADTAFHGEGETVGDEDVGFVFVPFNPTAENMAEYLVEVVGPSVFYDTPVELVKVTIDETRKCSATYTKEK